jgi:cobalt-zinc-cadmium resistance protein CzcA
MVRKLIEWGLHNPLIVLLLTCALIGVGVHAFLNINVEAYPDPAPAIIEVIAQFPGASAEEVERQVTIPLEVTLAGMPGLKYTRSKSLFGLSHLRNQFEYGFDYDKARQEVINRLQFTQQLPPGVTPQLSPETPTGEIFRYTLRSPQDALGRDIYTLSDLKALQDWVLEREFRRVPRIIDVTSSGGTIKRYEIHPDPDRLKLFGITLQQVQAALTNSNTNVGGGYVTQGDVAMNVRGVGLFGGGEDPVHQVLGMKDPDPEAAAALRQAEKDSSPNAPYLREAQRRRLALAASAKLRAEEQARIREIRSLVITSVNNKDILIEDIVEGGRLAAGQPAGVQGVVVGHQPRLGRVGLSKPQEVDSPTGIHRVLDVSGKLVWRNEDDKVQCIVLLRKGEDSLPALRDVRKRVEELNQPDSGRLLPGVLIEPYYDRTDLINVTTETVRENLILGMTLVTVILLMFLSNVRSALIVAINIPLALLFAFSVMYLRGKSANLLSIGAVDFGIIVDSSVIMVENIYRHVSSGEYGNLPLRRRIILACHEVERPLFFSTAIMVCAFIPLFTMQGPEGQIFGPMADTYAFALGGALLLALLLAPVLCLLLFKNLKPEQDNFLVRWLKIVYLRQLEFFLNHRPMVLASCGILLAVTLVAAFFFLGGEFMPELEEGNLWIRGTFPLNASLERVSANATKARRIISTYPEVEAAVLQIGRPDDGTDPTGFYNVEVFVPLRPEKDWPAAVASDGWRRFFQGAQRPRSKEELIKEMNDELNRKIPGVDWNFSQNIRDNVMESLSGVKGDNSIKIFGPDLNELERLAALLKNRIGGGKIPGIENVGVFNIKGQTNLEFRVDLEKCKRWGVSAVDVNNVIQTALAGKAFTTMIEGEKLFDITIRWPGWRRSSEASILDIPVDITNNQVVMSPGPGLNPAASGSGLAQPAKVGSLTDTSNPISNTPRLRLRDLISPVGKDGRPDSDGRFERAGASTIYREQGKRLIAVKFSVRGRDLAGAVADAKAQTADLVPAPYWTEWSGEFQEMEEANHRLMFIVPLALAMIFALLYLAFNSLVDVFVILSNVVAVSMGGVWGLILTGSNFNISAVVGFISIMGVGVMNGLLLVSYFNSLRATGLDLREALTKGVEKRIRPLTMTCLTAIFGLLPAALSTRIGSQSQRPLAIAVVGGMTMTLLLTNLIPVFYSFYGHREISAEGAGVQSLSH